MVADLAEELTTKLLVKVKPVDLVAVEGQLLVVHMVGKAAQLNKALVLDTQVTVTQVVVEILFMVVTVLVEAVVLDRLGLVQIPLLVLAEMVTAEMEFQTQ